MIPSSYEICVTIPFLYYDLSFYFSAYGGIGITDDTNLSGWTWTRQKLFFILGMHVASSSGPNFYFSLPDDVSAAGRSVIC
jgi:hypothetical protein